MKTAEGSVKRSSNRVVEIKISDIKANSAQPRKKFSKEAIERLAESIARNGLLQPLSVRKDGKGYELVAGERRLRALKLLNEKTAPCIVVSVSETQSAILAIIENIQREDLNLFEQADGIRQLITRWGVTQSEAAERLGLSQSAVANKLRILKLSQKEREMFLTASLSERHARAIIRIPEPKMRHRALHYIISNNLNVEKAEKYVDSLLNSEKKGGTKLVFKDLRIFVNTINMAVETMRRSGVMAKATKDENDKFIEYTIRIPKPFTVHNS